ncbi:type II toxin-antitoxin system death-on-curing family toxin [Synechococcus sp. BA-132 BA5]|uniref:type II toxin-antitoxin system death-on-curing family toxin n=1 Tax=Synechococcus sp. BA-132 BA5 TaxID=3110252 RepID=UPI002B20F0C9|nr:type II toxin-antitoxin system death-on-curing family toxin [Synechococcus sp. BA-132 BA5]MEA5415489.1 type II toxin-antitoxin system death-on-curing family toxin [Synechococcus sp. BA-132 BA5]
MTTDLSVIEVLAIHDDQIRRYGGCSGVQDPGLLEAALFRPQTGYYADLIEEAAALWESLSQNHPFVDGNKRTAFAVTFTFLAINGCRLTVDADTAFAFIAGLHRHGTFRFPILVPWLRLNVAGEALPEADPEAGGAPQPLPR